MRINSIDAVRGLTVAAMLLVNDAGDWSHVYPWLEHAEWNGCTPADFIYPIFMLIVGVSITLALERRLDACPADQLPALQRGLTHSVLLRALRIVLLGVALHVAAALMLHGRDFRLLGVLQRAGICYAVAGMLAIHIRSARAQWTLLATILLGYWALLVLGGPLEPVLNLADRLDSALLGPLAYQYDPASGHAHDPEGILGTLPALATVILGMRAGAWLRAGRIRSLAAGGAVAMLLGAVWSLLLPLNKQLWTSSFVLWTGGFGMLAIAMAHQLIDVRGWSAIGRSFGINAIAAYAGSWLATCLIDGSGIMAPLYATLFGGPLTPLTGPYVPSLLFAIAFTAVFWLLARVFARRGWQITI
jgi:predicted acyltransferase